MKVMKTQFSGLLFFIATLSSFAQEQEIFKSQSHIGYSIFQPNFGRKPLEAVDVWQGFEFNNRFAVISFHQGSIRNTTLDSTHATTPASILRFSGYLGKTYNIGKSPLFSFGIEPYILIGGTLAQVPNKIMKDPITSFGLHIAPGLTARFSHFSIGFNYNVGTYLSTNVTGGNNQYTYLRKFGFLGGFSATVAINSGFDLLYPKEFTFKGYNVSRTETRKEREGWDSRGRYLEITTTTTTTYNPGTRSLTLVSPFWGIGPYRGFYSQRNGQASTAINGVNTGFRFHGIQLDAFYGKGVMGLKDETNFKDILITYPQLRDYDFSSQVPVSEYGIRAGVNLSKFFALSNFNMTDNKSRIARVGVPFIRLHGNFTYGVLQFQGVPEFTYTNAANRINEFQQLNNIISSAENNPHFLPQRSIFSAWGANLEIGACFVQLTWYRINDAPVANHMHMSIGANFPILRFFNSARTRLL
jgi:hypothetical protein